MIDSCSQALLTKAMTFCRTLHYLMPAGSILIALSLSNCSLIKPKINSVSEFNVLNENYQSYPLGLHRAQAAYILHGAKTKKEFKDKLGQFYTVNWIDSHTKKPLDLVFYYRQASTNSLILTKREHFPVGRKADIKNTIFSVQGDEYNKKGRVTSWKVILEDNGQPISAESSYLWSDQA